MLVECYHSRCWSDLEAFGSGPEWTPTRPVRPPRRSTPPSGATAPSDIRIL